MDVTFHTLIYASARIDVDELSKVSRYLERFLGKEFVKRTETDESCVNKVVSKLHLSNIYIDNLKHKSEDT